jgi:hypothetical protein
MEFFVFERRVQLKSESVNSSSATLTLSRLKFDELRLECDRLMLKARESQSEVWLELLKSVPGQAALNKAGTDFRNCVQQCESAFEKLLQLSSNSVQTLRRYAHFLGEVSFQGSPLFLRKDCVAFRLTLLLVARFVATRNGLGKWRNKRMTRKICWQRSSTSLLHLVTSI